MTHTSSFHQNFSSLTCSQVARFKGLFIQNEHIWLNFIKSCDVASQEDELNDEGLHQ
jgi:hypothetical protein